LQGDITTVDWWTQGDIVFAHCTCFDDTLMAKVAKLADKLRKGSIFITVSHPLRSPLFELVETLALPMSWGHSTVYLHKRKAMAKWVAIAAPHQRAGSRGSNTTSQHTVAASTTTTSVSLEERRKRREEAMLRKMGLG
jgi:hypothetical protein